MRQLILLMIRGRHRGLPVAIDRAIMLPKVFARVGAAGEGEASGHSDTKETDKQGDQLQ